MCGIFGQISRPGQKLSTRDLRRATDRLRHRGPDDCGYWLVDSASGFFSAFGGDDSDVLLGLPRIPDDDRESFNIGFGFRRLAIFDLSLAGHQPMYSAESQTCLMLNGAIYNHLELRSVLEKHGYKFESKSDTEVLLKAWVCWGAGCLSRLEGMFAGAVINLRAATVTLFRDYFGIKPLYWTVYDGGLAFASEISALLEQPAVRPRANLERLREFLLAGITDHHKESLFAGVEQLPPAHFLEIPFDLRQLEQPRPYWQLNRGPETNTFCDLESASAVFRQLILDSVSLHSRCDVEVGASLSGGLDSSTIVAALDHLGSQKKPLHTFSYCADDSARNEIPWLCEMEQQVRCEPHHFTVPLDRLSADMDRLLSFQGEPFESPAIVAQYYLYQEVVRQRIKVVLDGQGADELLAGYPVYVPLLIAWLLGSGRWLAGLRVCYYSGPRLNRSRWALLREAADRSRQLGKMLHHGDDPAKPSWIDRGWLAQFPRSDFLETQPHGFAPLHAHLHHSLSVSLPFLLRCEDRNSMACAVESRVPFLSRRVAEFCFSLPESFLLDEKGRGKALLRQAVAGFVAPGVLARRGKVGFASPSPRWIDSLAPWVETTLKDARDLSPRCLDWNVLNSSWQQIRRGLASPKTAAKACSEFENNLWRALILVRWASRYEVPLTE